MKRRCRPGVGIGRPRVAMACAGAFGTLVQVLLGREFLVVVLGNELTLGLLLSAWLLLAAAGALAARRPIARWPEQRLRRALAALWVAAALLLPVQVGAIRVLRGLLRVPYGEYMALGPLGISLAGILLPTGLLAGATLPAICRLAAPGSAWAVSRAYLAEAVGSLAAGALFSFVLVDRVTPAGAVLVASALALAAAACLAPGRRGCRAALLAAAGAVILAACPAGWAPLERAGIAARWRSLGALPASGGARLAASCDSRYQNLALIEREGQFSVYANGQVAFTFPDPVASEHKIHFVMAQNPGARRVLLLGGNPVDDVPELLKYPLARLVHVELDGRLDEMIEPGATPAYRRALADPRLVRVRMDALRYLKEAGRSEPFDAVLADLPTPDTVALNRFYTLECFDDVRRLLAPGGFFWTTIEASEDLRNESALLSASILRSLRAVFPRVLVTAGVRNQFLAGARTSPITLDRAVLCARSTRAAPAARTFRPDYFLAADELQPANVAYVEARLASLPVAANTILKPVSIFYGLAAWNRITGSGLDSILACVARGRPDTMAAALLLAGAACLGAGLTLGRRARAGGGAAGRRFATGVMALVMAATGFCGLALELLALVCYQSLLGYVYSRMGLIVAAFMLGLAAGAAAAPRLAGANAGRAWRFLLAGVLLLGGSAAGIPLLAHSRASGILQHVPGGWMEALLYALIAAAGVAVAAQFALLNGIVAAMPVDRGRESDRPRAAARWAAAMYAADCLGAAFGGLATSVALLPLFGIGPACLLLTALQAASLLALLAARAAVPARRASP